MLYCKDKTSKFFGLEIHAFSFQVISTNEFFLDSAKFSMLKLIVSLGTYKKLCSLMNFHLSFHKKLGSLILKVQFLGGGFLLYLIEQTRSQGKFNRCISQ